MSEYSEIQAPEGDAEGRVLDTLSEGMPYAFVVATSIEPLNIRVASGHDVGVIRPLLNQTLRALPGGMDDVTDGYHTFKDLYDHRRALTAVLAAGAAGSGESWRSKAHHPDDGPIFPGYFIVGIDLPNGTITYHYELEYWDDFIAVPEREHSPKWDGAPPADTVTRLLELARQVSVG